MTPALPAKAKFIAKPWCPDEVKNFLTTYANCANAH